MIEGVSRALIKSREVKHLCSVLLSIDRDDNSCSHDNIGSLLVPELIDFAMYSCSVVYTLPNWEVCICLPVLFVLATQCCRVVMAVIG